MTTFNARRLLVPVILLAVLVLLARYSHLVKEHFYPDNAPVAVRPLRVLPCYVDKPVPGESKNCIELASTTTMPCPDAEYQDLLYSSMDRADPKPGEDNKVYFCCPKGYKANTDKYPPFCELTNP